MRSEGAKRAIQALGGKVQLAAEVPHEVQDRELGTHALKLRDSGADVVIPVWTVTAGANLLKEMAKVGYKPQIFAPFPYGDHQMMFRLLGELWEGVYYNGNIPSPTDPESMRHPGDDQAGREAQGPGELRPRRRDCHGDGRGGAQAGRAEPDPRGIRRGHGEHPELGARGAQVGADHLRARTAHGLNTVRLYRAKKAADQSFVPVTEFQSFPPLF